MSGHGDGLVWRAGRWQVCVAHDVVGPEGVEEVVRLDRRRFRWGLGEVEREGLAGGVVGLGWGLGSREVPGG